MKNKLVLLLTVVMMTAAFMVGCGSTATTEEVEVVEEAAAEAEEKECRQVSLRAGQRKPAGRQVRLAGKHYGKQDGEGALVN